MQNKFLIIDAKLIKTLHCYDDYFCERRILFKIVFYE